MFTGIVAAVGRVEEFASRKGGAVCRFDTGALSLAGIVEGSSIAVNGACLTVTEFGERRFSADVSAETLVCTTLGELEPGAPVNLERALALGDELGGHLVTGHVDGVGTVRSFEPDGDGYRLRIEAPESLAHLIARKGSICVDGVSLTVNEVDAAEFGLMIIPHTREETIIRKYLPGTRVNLEVDMIARYLERIVQYTAR